MRQISLRVRRQACLRSKGPRVLLERFAPRSMGWLWCQGLVLCRCPRRPNGDGQVTQDRWARWELLWRIPNAIPIFERQRASGLGQRFRQVPRMLRGQNVRPRAARMLRRPDHGDWQLLTTPASSFPRLFSKFNSCSPNSSESRFCGYSFYGRQNAEPEVLMFRFFITLVQFFNLLTQNTHTDRFCLAQTKVFVNHVTSSRDSILF